MQQQVSAEVKGQKVTLTFDHCLQCSYVNRCYENGQGPSFIDPSCLLGPA